MFTTRTQGDVTILWCPDVDCQWDKGHFTFGVQGEWNGLADNIKNTKEIGSFKRTLFKNMFHTK